MNYISNVHKKTIHEYRQLPEGAPFELIDGNFVEEPSPEYAHQDILASLFSYMRIYAEEKQLGKVLAAPMDVYFDEENVFQPDILYISQANIHKIQKDGIHGAPDLVIEILSAGNSRQDFTIKLHTYERYGVSEYFIVDPDSKEVIAYSRRNKKYREIYREEGILKSKILGRAFEF